MKLTFLGTRGNIEARSRQHYMHSSLLVSHYGKRIKIDCGEDWLGRADAGDPHAIFVTHAHSDHIGGLKHGAACPVYATADSWQEVLRYKINDRRVISRREPVRLGRLSIEAFTVVHSLLSPAVGYRIAGGSVTIFYVPDLVDIRQMDQGLHGVRLYIGDGASMVRPIIRKRDGQAFGHTTVKRQLAWCGEHNVPRMIVTHCGTQIVAGDQAKLAEQLEAMAGASGVTAAFAHDGMTLLLR